MNRDDIIRMAREAGFVDGVVDIIGFDGFANFVALVAAAEREACAQIAFNAKTYIEAAAAIRSRGER
jgi:hypothetical protein